jgi:hypothetical protein
MAINVIEMFADSLDSKTLDNLSDNELRLVLDILNKAGY